MREANKALQQLSLQQLSLILFALAALNAALRVRRIIHAKTSLRNRNVKRVNLWPFFF